MKQAVLRQLKIENFGNIKAKEIQFGKRTVIRGENESGKTTIGDAYSWTMTNSLMNGSQADKIRPHDASGKDVDYVDIVATVTLDIDGRTVEIQKTQAQDWVKKTGEFKGNNNTYLVNGIPKKKEKDFKEFMADIVPEDVFRICTSSAAFLKLDTAARRQKLFDMIPGLTDDDVVAKSDEFLPIKEMLKDGSIEELISRENFQINGRGRGDRGLKGRLDDIPTRIDEASKGIKDVAECELAIKTLNRQISEVDEDDKQLDEIGKSYDLKLAEINELENKRQNLEIQLSAGLIEERKEKQREISTLEAKKVELEAQLKIAELDYKHASMAIQRNQAELDAIREQYKRVTESSYDDSKISSIEAEKFNDTTLICPTCKQELPNDQKTKIRSMWESGKKKRLDEEMRQKSQFEENKQKNLAEIIQDGNVAAANLKSSQETKEKSEELIATCKQDLMSLSMEIAEKKNVFHAMPASADMSNSDEYQKISALISQKRNELSSTDNVAEQRNLNRGKRNQLVADIERYKAYIKQSNDASDRVTELKRQKTEIAQALADCQARLKLLKKFNKAKCDMLTEKVNQLFRFTQWKLFEFNQDGESYREICEPTFKGTMYSKRLNDGAKGLIDIDIPATFQNAYEVSLPIWVDNAERITDKTAELIKDLDCQLILLKADDCQLTVENED